MHTLDNKQRLEAEEDSSGEQKNGRSIVREGFCRTGRGRSFHVEGSKKEFRDH